MRVEKGILFTFPLTQIFDVLNMFVIFLMLVEEIYFTPMRFWFKGSRKAIDKIEASRTMKIDGLLKIKRVFYQVINF